MLLKNILGDTRELDVNHSRRFIESPRSIDTLCSVSQRTTDPEKRKIGEPRTQLSTLLEIYRISKKVRYETHQYLNPFKPNIVSLA
jgi:hypothetical protein